MTVRRALYISALATLVGSSIASLVELAAGRGSATAIGAGLIATCLVALMVWDDPRAEQELRFTERGTLFIGWLLTWFLPPAGIVIGAVLARQGSRGGRTLLYVSIGLTAFYAVAFAIVSAG